MTSLPDSITVRTLEAGRLRKRLTIAVVAAAISALPIAGPAQGTASADIAVSKSDNPDPATAGGSLMYTVTVSNGVPSTTAFATTLTDDLPEEVTAAGTPITTQGSCSPPQAPDPEVSCSLGDVAFGTPVTVTIQVTVNANASGLITNSATGVHTGDANTQNNTGIAFTFVCPPPGYPPQPCALPDIAAGPNPAALENLDGAPAGRESTPLERTVPAWLILVAGLIIATTGAFMVSMRRARLGAHARGGRRV